MYLHPQWESQHHPSNAIIVAAANEADAGNKGVVVVVVNVAMVFRGGASAVG